MTRWIKASYKKDLNVSWKITPTCRAPKEGQTCMITTKEGKVLICEYVSSDHGYNNAFELASGLGYAIEYGWDEIKAWSPDIPEAYKEEPKSDEYSPLYGELDEI